MAETISTKDEVTRDEAADLLQELARELRGEDTANVRVGNKTLTLSPASVLEYSIEVEERSPMLGGDREEITLSLGWDTQDSED